MRECACGFFYNAINNAITLNIWKHQYSNIELPSAPCHAQSQIELTLAFTLTPSRPKQSRAEQSRAGVLRVTPVRSLCVGGQRPRARITASFHCSLHEATLPFIDTCVFYLYLINNFRTYLPDIKKKSHLYYKHEDKFLHRIRGGCVKIKSSTNLL